MPLTLAIEKGRSKGLKYKPWKPHYFVKKIKMPFLDPI